MLPSVISLVKPTNFLFMIFSLGSELSTPKSRHLQLFLDFVNSAPDFGLISAAVFTATTTTTTKSSPHHQAT